MDQDLIIVGAGLAGASAAEALRDSGFEGSVTIVGTEDEAPYIRPPLSKEFLAGSAEEDSPYVHPREWYAERSIGLEAGVTAVDLDLGGHGLVLDDGRRLKYDRLLLATGAVPRRLTIPGAELPGVHYLRTFGDSRELKSLISGGGRKVAIVGAGWIGLEVASTARSLGNEVTVIGMEDIPLAAIVGERIGEVFASLHREHGVELRMSTRTSRIAGDGQATGVVLESGETVPADVVVVGIGAVPSTGLAEKAGLEVDNGILVDQTLRTSDPDVFAAGDVANELHPVLGRRIRVEHWANALNQGQAAGQSMAGQQVSYDRVPYFYTDQFDLGMEYSGYPGAAKGELVVRGDLASREFIAFWLDDGRVAAGMNVNVWDVNPAIEELIRSGRRVDAGRLANADIPLEGL